MEPFPCSFFFFPLLTSQLMIFELKVKNLLSSEQTFCLKASVKQQNWWVNREMCTSTLNVVKVYWTTLVPYERKKGSICAFYTLYQFPLFIFSFEESCVSLWSKILGPEQALTDLLYPCTCIRYTGTTKVASNDKILD